MIIIPLLAYGGLVASIVSRHFALKAMESTLNLKSVDFLQDRVKFNFNRPQYNFICGYNDINNLEMILNTVMVHNKYGSYPAVSEINLNFRVVCLAPALIDYVIVHELMHTIEMNHSTKFWEKVGKILPNFKELRRQIHAFGFLLNLF